MNMRERAYHNSLCGRAVKTTSRGFAFRRRDYRPHSGPERSHTLPTPGGTIAACRPYTAPINGIRRRKMSKVEVPVNKIKITKGYREVRKQEVDARVAMEKAKA